MKIHNSLVSNILDRPQRYFAHVTTVTLSWRVQNIVVIGRIHLTLECFEFSSNFEFDRNMLSGTGAWSVVYTVYRLMWATYNTMNLKVRNSCHFVLAAVCSNVPCYATVCSIMTVQPIYNLNISIITYGYLPQKIIMSLAKSIVNASQTFLIITVSNKTVYIYWNYYFFIYCNFDHCIVIQISINFL